ncbi:hypothetical protein TPY_2730 [Sulfobacillus acidophilus TPY]|uniref:Dephospho-CoA kinase n=1 Tax=Sulfobacillus acidophilus (strain ATCC 700253 / DSM 10332 / NAL) TaxID=679936 RepID=G8TUK4_SULAD|nr:hypothetical protein TPY_2730 [Sulfobacillus acidophilus TPY]AEW04651.1 hypothetical protein Sulac_1151 [Sulfobacillus acidophilus DSM 10332]
MAQNPTGIKPLIGLAGLMGAGKDTVAAWFGTMWGYRRIAFADPLRIVIRDWFPDQSRNRRLYQALGDWARSIRPTVFLDWVERRIRDGGPWIVTDIRFPVEAQWVKDHGGLLIGVDAPEAVRFARVAARDGASGLTGQSHASEQQWNQIAPLCDVVIHNDGTLEDLEQALRGVVARLMGS